MMQRQQLLTTSHRETDAQLASRQWLPTLKLPLLRIATKHEHECGNPLVSLGKLSWLCPLPAFCLASFLGGRLKEERVVMLCGYCSATARTLLCCLYCVSHQLKPWPCVDCCEENWLCPSQAQYSDNILALMDFSELESHWFKGSVISIDYKMSWCKIRCHFSFFSLDCNVVVFHAP